MAIAGWKRCATPWRRRRGHERALRPRGREWPALDDIPITIIGHPYAPIGMGEQMRSHVQGLTALGLHHRVFDIFRYAQRTDAAHFQVIGERERRDLPGGIRIFHINGDEVEPVLREFEARGGRSSTAGYNIIVPAWELPRYPGGVGGRTCAASTRCGRCRASSRRAWPRAGVDEPLDRPGRGTRRPGRCCRAAPSASANSAFVLLTLFDISSYPSRKNPEAVLALLEPHPAATIRCATCNSC